VIFVTNLRKVGRVQCVVRFAWPMPNAKERTMSTDNAKAVEADRELTLKELDAVGGGLNPQPLPPRWIEPGMHFLNPQPLPPG
jgi:hypothetical protein